VKSGRLVSTPEYKQKGGGGGRSYPDAGRKNKKGALGRLRIRSPKTRTEVKWGGSGWGHGSNSYVTEAHESRGRAG